VLLEYCATQVLIDSIHALMASQYQVGRETITDLSEFLRRLTSPIPAQKKNTFGLTPREIEIISAIVAGYANIGIASDNSRDDLDFSGSKSERILFLRGYRRGQPS